MNDSTIKMKEIALKSSFTDQDSKQKAFNQEANIYYSSITSIDKLSDIPSIVWSEESFSENISSASDNHAEKTPEAIKSTINSKQNYSSKRKKIILISVIILLILIIIVIMTTLTTIFISQNTTDKITTENVNSYLGTTKATPIIYDVGNGGISGDPPCLSYTVIDDPLRHVSASGIGGVCDTGPFFNTSIGGRWIRFIGTGGTIISPTPVGIQHCGAFLTGWFNGTLPSTIGTIVNGIVCFQSPIELCTMPNSVSVVNCDNFYVYFLPPTIVCNARYCTV